MERRKVYESKGVRPPGWRTTGLIMKHFLWPILVGLLVSVVLFLVGGIFSAGGHNFTLMMIFFPLASMLTLVSENLMWWMILFGALQFPVYALFLAVAQRRNTLFWVIGLMAIIHVFGIVWCFVLDKKESWRVLF